MIQNHSVISLGDSDGESLSQLNQEVARRGESGVQRTNTRGSEKKLNVR